MSWIKDWTGYLIGSTSPQVSKTGSPKDVYAGAFGLTDFPTFGLQQIKPDIFSEIHAVVINAAGIGSGLLQRREHIILQ
jgi:hypothetical protein